MGDAVTIRLIEPGDADGYLAVFETVAAEGRWIGTGCQSTPPAKVVSGSSHHSSRQPVHGRRRGRGTGCRIRASQRPHDASD